MLWIQKAYQIIQPEDGIQLSIFHQLDIPHGYIDIKRYSDDAEFIEKHTIFSPDTLVQHSVYKDKNPKTSSRKLGGV